MDAAKHDEDEKLLPPSSFPSFPYMPYVVQSDFMVNLYDAIENGKLGIFESPTGTGKSLSIICGSLSWLKDHESRKEKSLISRISSLNEAKNLLSTSCQKDWIQQKAEEMMMSHQIEGLQAQLEKMKLKSEKLKKLRMSKSMPSEKSVQRYKYTKTDLKIDDETPESSSSFKDDDQDLVLESSESEEEQTSEPGEGNAEYECTKILYATRTHSQLQQFVKEVKKTDYFHDIRLVPLASRANYCNNLEVKKLKSAALINQRCLDMQKTKEVTTFCDEYGHRKKKKKTKCIKSCPYLTHSKVEVLTDHILCELGDIEDIVAQGNTLSACSYYSTRAAIKDAQIVVMPYQVLLHKSTREAYGLNIKGNVIIIDEAHNILEAISAIYSAYLDGKQLSNTVSMLETYKNRFETRFKPDNLKMINEIITVVSNLLKFLDKKCAEFKINSDKGLTVKPLELFTINEFMVYADIADINIFKHLVFIEEKKLPQKLQGYVDRFYFADRYPAVAPVKEIGPKAFLKYMEAKQSSSVQCTVKTMPEKVFKGNPLQEVVHFVESLTNKNENGRVILCCEEESANSILKYIVLNPSLYFEDIVKEARSVIVAGGTMQPFDEFIEELYVSAGGCRSRIMEFSCGHVIPKENILPIAVSVGPSGQTFEFNYQNRSSPKMIFVEPKGSGVVEQLLKSYESAIDTCKKTNSSQNGALLFSVIGGKLSEGLNFSDDLGRCVIVLGLPYPNIKSPELAEKMKYLHAKKIGLGRQYYENLCMKAVNQSIGRAVRHHKDFSSILLVDTRFSHNHIQNSLPSWIRTSLKTYTTFGPVMGELAKFFRGHKTTNA